MSRRFLPLCLVLSLVGCTDASSSAGLGGGGKADDPVVEAPSFLSLQDIDLRGQRGDLEAELLQDDDEDTFTIGARVLIDRAAEGAVPIVDVRAEQLAICDVIAVRERDATSVELYLGAEFEIDDGINSCTYSVTAADGVVSSVTLFTFVGD